MRTGILASYLADEGNQVTWWSSTYIHGDKKYRAEKNTKVKLKKNEVLIMLHSSVCYKRNVSFSRVYYHHLLAEQFNKISSRRPKPDIIICSYPTVQLVIAAEKYAKNNNIPIIVDVRDMWPDVFIDAVPNGAKGIGNVLLKPLIRQSYFAFRDADALTSVNPYMLNWAQERGKRSGNDSDQAIFISYDKGEDLSEKEKAEELSKWKKLGVTSATWNICFVGTLSYSLDMQTCIKAVKKLSSAYPQLRLVICGDGDCKEIFEKEAADCKNVIFPGWCDNHQAKALFSIGKIGLYPYKNTVDFVNAFGNKIVQYMAEKLPVVSSLSGFSKKYIIDNKIGKVYAEGDKNSFSAVIKDFIDNESCRNNMSLRAYEKFQLEFSPTVINKKFDDVILKVLRKKGKNDE